MKMVPHMVTGCHIHIFDAKHPNLRDDLNQSSTPEERLDWEEVRENKKS